jgi:hypothetical protein
MSKQNKLRYGRWPSAPLPNRSVAPATPAVRHSVPAATLRRYAPAAVPLALLVVIGVFAATGRLGAPLSDTGEHRQAAPGQKRDYQGTCTRFRPGPTPCFPFAILKSPVATVKIPLDTDFEVVYNSCQ